MHVSPTTVALLALVAALAGLVDAIGGGGGLLTVPALLAAGLPPHLALGTNKGCSTFGTGAATITFARAKKLRGTLALVGFVGGCIGAIGGARAQLALSPDALKPIVLVLLVVVAVVLVVQRPKARALDEDARDPSTLAAFAIAVVLGAYDGFFGPGTGTFVIVAHASLLGATLGEATASAKAVNLGSNVASLITFALRNTVIWAIALPMAAGNVVGNVIGARLAVRGGDRVVRWVVVAVSLALVTKLTIDLLGR